MKPILLTILFSITCIIVNAQQQFNIHNIHLPSPIEEANNQFSGLYVQKGNLFFLSECRLQENAEAKLYSIKISDIDKQIKDSNYALPYQKITIQNLNVLRNKIDATGKAYEGLEAMVVDGKNIYLSVETATPVDNCYLLKGSLQDSTVIMDTSFLVTLPKPLQPNGSKVYNAGFEAMHIKNNTVILIYEYNNFNLESYTTSVDVKTKAVSYGRINNLPFRLTDVTQTSKNKYTVLNFFYKGGGDDEVYRVPQTDTSNYKLMFNQRGEYASYARLVTGSYKNNTYTWQPLFTIPGKYAAYNWEGIAAHKNGYLIINDKYTDARPYKTTLLYLQPL